MKKKIQANISGYQGKACSLFAVLDTDTGVLNILKNAKSFQARNSDFVLITNLPRQDSDFFVDTTMLLDSIQSYYRIKTGLAEDGVTPLLSIGDQVGGANPESGIEINGISTSGADYRISPDIKNLQIAVLCICLYAERITVINDALDMFDTLNSEKFNGVFTI